VIVAFGAAATAAHLMKLPADRIANALALTASLCPWGTYEPLGKPHSDDGFVQIGAGARSGVYAAELARAGFTGNRSALEGASGLYFAGTGRADPPAGLLKGLGSLWHLDQVMSKPYPCGSPNTYPIYCADRLVQDHGMSHDDIEAIEIRTPDISRQRMVAIRNPGPFKAFEEAIISCYFTVAATLVFGRFDVDVAMQAVDDPRVEALAQRMQFVTVQPPYPKGSSYAVVTVTLRDGRALTASSSTMPKALQHPDWSEMTARFRALTENALSDESRERVIAAVRDLDERPDCRAVIACLRSEFST
jgi:2-methylcitrate dehydratase PrpD